jgi:hypothetical protein
MIELKLIQDIKFASFRRIVIKKNALLRRLNKFYNTSKFLIKI